MKVLASTGNEAIALAYIARMDDGRLVEFVESVQPPIPRERKWVLIVSTLCGCPLRCRFCDAGGYYEGKLSRDQMIYQIDYLIRRRFPDGRVPAKKFKIQFARMGEPALNRHVLDVLEELPERYDAPGLMPSLSTVAPVGSGGFFEGLLDIKERLYRGRFQLQFSIHSTDRHLRDWLVPARTWDLGAIAKYGERFRRAGERKVTLNFALAEGMPIDPGVMLTHFDPDTFLVKITPVNPTYRASESGIASRVKPGEDPSPVIDGLTAAGYEVLLSIGELEENQIGSNCGQHIVNYLRRGTVAVNGYTYRLRAAPPRPGGPTP